MQQREFKFRSWDNQSKEWLLGYELPNLGGFSMFGEVMLFQEWSNVVNRFILNQRDRKEEDLILMQYTGLKDKNGKEIYEGDVVTCITKDALVEWENKGIVEFVAPSFAIYCGIDLLSEIEPEPKIFTWFEYNEDFEVIGNIYENPELLTTGADPKTKPQN